MTVLKRMWTATNVILQIPQGWFRQKMQLGAGFLRSGFTRMPEEWAGPGRQKSKQLRLLQGQLLSLLSLKCTSRPNFPLNPPITWADPEAGRSDSVRLPVEWPSFLLLRVQHQAVTLKQPSIAESWVVFTIVWLLHSLAVLSRLPLLSEYWDDYRRVPINPAYSI